MKITNETKGILKKILEFCSKIWQTIFLATALLLIFYYFGINLKYLPILILISAISELKLFPEMKNFFRLILRISLALIIVGIIINSYFPRVKSGLGLVIVSIDQKFSSNVDKTDVFAKDTWENERAEASKSFLRYYSFLLSKGKTKEAADTLTKFQRCWDMEIAKSEIDIKSIEPKNQVKNPIAHSKIANQKVGGLYTVGEHVLNLKNGEESDWCIIQPCHAYTFLRGTTCRFILIYEDGTTAESWGTTGWPGKYKFKVKSLNDEMPILKIL